MDCSVLEWTIHIISLPTSLTDLWGCWEDYKSQRQWIISRQPCFLDTTEQPQPMSSVIVITRTRPEQAPAGRRLSRWPWNPTTCWRLLGEEESIFFNDVSPARFSTLQGRAPPKISWAIKNDFMGAEEEENSKLGGWGGEDVGLGRGRYMIKLYCMKFLNN